MSILDDVVFEEALKDYRTVARKRSEGICSKLQRLNQEARIRYGYVPASGGTSTQPSLAEKSIESLPESSFKIKPRKSE